MDYIRGNIPALLTPLIGREREANEIYTLLQRLEVRLLSLCGTGGVGKTCLALQVAAELQKSFPDGIFFVPLAPVTDPDRVLPSIAQGLGIGTATEQPLFEHVQSFLRGKHLLLLLDNFEQVLPAGPLLTELLSACPILKIMVTSRAVLRVRGEYEFEVPPLALPDIQHLPAIEVLAQNPSVALFVQRAQAVKHDFELTSTNIHPVAQICITLDGLPLAIELAAARIKLLPPYPLLARLKQRRLRLLTDGTRDVPERQQTLQNTIAWSYDLLNDYEQRLFRRLSVFVGGCTLEAAEAVSNAGHSTSLINIVDGVASLINKSLLKQVEQGDSAEGEPRLFMLETLREYSLERLIESRELEVARQAHVDYYLKLVEEAEPQYHSAKQTAIVEQLEREHDNLRTALGWCIEHGMSEQALRFVGALGWFWLVNNYEREGRLWLEKALTGSEGVEASVRGKAINAAAMLTFDPSESDIGQAEVLYKQNLVLFQELADKRGIGLTLFRLGGINKVRRNYAAAQEQFAAALALLREVGDKANSAYALEMLGDIALEQGEYTRARSLIEEGLTMLRTLDDKRGIAALLNHLGRVYWLQGEYAQAQTLMEEGIMLFKEAKAPLGYLSSLELLALVTVQQKEFARACVLLEEGLVESRMLGNKNFEVMLLMRLGQANIAQHNYIVALTQLEETLTLCRELDNKVGIAYVRYQLGQVAFGKGEYAKARSLVEEGLAFFKSVNDQVNTVLLLQFLGIVMLYQGEYAQAQAALEESLALHRAADSKGACASCLYLLALVTIGQRNFARTRSLLEESLALSRVLGSQSRAIDIKQSTAYTLLHLGRMLFFMAKQSTAMKLLEESLALLEEVDDKPWAACLHFILGQTALSSGHDATARSLLTESLSRLREVESNAFIAACLEGLGRVIAAMGQPTWAAHLWGAAETFRVSNAIPPTSDIIEGKEKRWLPIESPVLFTTSRTFVHALLSPGWLLIELPVLFTTASTYEEAVVAVRSQLGEVAFRAAWAEGKTMTPEQVFTVQRRRIISPATVSLDPQLSYPDMLTRREIEVLCLVAAGLTDVQIAEKLVLSPRTVNAHLRSIYGKLNINSRSAATRYALEHHLA